MIEGFDYSFWQDQNSTPAKPDPGKAFAAGARFVFVRAGQDRDPDPDYTDNWAACKQAGLLRGAYHFYDYRHAAIAQAQAMISWLKDDMGELPPVIDLEVVREWGRPKRVNILAAILDYIMELESHTHRSTIIYTNPDMIINILRPVPDWLKAHPLWVAHYGVPHPMIGDWPMWHFWQYSSTGNGPQYGMESKGVDLDRWYGTLEELHAFANIDPPAPTWQQAITTWARSQGYTGPDPE